MAGELASALGFAGPEHCPKKNTTWDANKLSNWLPGRMSERMPLKMSNSARLNAGKLKCQILPNIAKVKARMKPVKAPERTRFNIPYRIPNKMSDRLPERKTLNMSDRIHIECLLIKYFTFKKECQIDMPGNMSDRMWEYMPDRKTECQIECRDINTKTVNTHGR